jgi:ATP/maltotriose-dependent transcriptional regulator MalT
MATELSVKGKNEFEDLIRALEWSDEFAIYFAVINLPLIRKQMADELKRSLGKEKIQVHSLELNSSYFDLLSIIPEKVPSYCLRGAETVIRSVVFIFGAEEAIAADVDTRRLFFDCLNWQRDKLRETIVCPLVIWLPEFALRILALEAPDFWAWRSGVYYLEPEPVGILRDTEELLKVGTSEYDVLTYQEKIKRLQQFKALLEDYKVQKEVIEDRVTTIDTDYIAGTLLQELVIPEIASRLAGKAGEKGVRLKDIEKPKWLQGIGKWLDDHQVSTPEKVEKIINEHQEEIVRELTEHKGELSDLGQQIFDAVNELKERIDNARLTDEDKEFLAEVKNNFDPDEFENRLEKILQKNAGVDQQKLREELTIFFKNMGWGNKLDVINSKVDLVLQSIEDVKVGIKDVKVGIVDLGGKIDKIEKSSKIEIQYFPDTPPDVSEFVDRKTYLDELRNSIDTENMIIIQGIAGIGKTQIAAKLQQNIKDEYITFWKELRDVETFDSMSRTLARFLMENGDSELAEYIEDGTTDHDIIMNLLLSSLENKNYVLFFDNYHVVAKKEIHDLFSRFKDRLKGSTIIITTRNPPPFVSQIDHAKKKVTKGSIEGFDLEATKEYLEQMGVYVSSEQLIELDKQMGGHPLALLMFASLADEMDVAEILENFPETGIENYLYDEIYELLNKDERRVLEALSVFRTPVTSEACVSVAKCEKAKKTLNTLKEKLLVKRKEKLYYLHGLIRDFSYNLIDNPKEYHRLAGEYYAQLEKTPENILETTYHMIKDTGVVNDEVVKYLIGTTKDHYTSFIVLEILKENEITSSDVFVLLNEFVSTSDLTIQKMFVIGYGDFFEKVWSINPEKSIDILKQILNSADSKLLVMLSRTLAKIAYKFPDEACDLWRAIIDKGDIDMREFVSFDIVNSNIDPKKAAHVLKYLLRRNEELGYAPSSYELWPVKYAFDNLCELESRLLTHEEHLEKLKNMSKDAKHQLEGKPESELLELRFNLLREAGEISFSIANYKDAEQYFIHGLKIAERLKDKELLAEIFGNLSLVSLAQENYTSAEVYTKKCLEIAQEIGDKEEMAGYFLILGTFAKSPHKAEEVFKKGLKIGKELENKDVTALALILLGRVAEDQKKFAEAKSFFVESLKIYEEIGDKKGIVDNLIELSDLAKSQGNFDEAVRRIKEAQANSKDMKDYHITAKILEKQGSLARDQGDYQHAQRYYEESLENSKQLGDKRNIASIYTDLGRIAEDIGNYERAKKCYKESLKISKEIGLTSQSLLNKLYLSSLYRNKEDLYEA